MELNCHNHIYVGRCLCQLSSYQYTSLINQGVALALTILVRPLSLIFTVKVYSQGGSIGKGRRGGGGGGEEGAITSVTIVLTGYVHSFSEDLDRKPQTTLLSLSLLPELKIGFSTPDQHSLILGQVSILT